MIGRAERRKKRHTESTVDPRHSVREPTKWVGGDGSEGQGGRLRYPRGKREGQLGGLGESNATEERGRMRCAG
jgi:hypothetical protein